MSASIRLPVESLRTDTPAELVSQKTSEAVLGIDRRRFLESLPDFRAAGGDVLRLGKLRLVRPAAYIEWLGARLAARDKGVDDVADLAESMGLRLVGGDHG